MRLKILPALHSLYTAGKLAEDMRVVGVSRRSWNHDELRGYVREVLPDAEDSFLTRFECVQGDVEDSETFSSLLTTYGSDELLFYFALSPALYTNVFSHMKQVGFSAKKDTTRVMIEKPFGTSGVVAEQLYTQLQDIVAEQNIFLVDHYLAKDWVRGLSALAIQPEDISQIHVRFFETLGVEKRGPLYDQVGAFRDTGQNHVLQMVVHVLAARSQFVSGEARAEMLEQLPICSAEAIAAQTLRAQYQGYTDITGVAAHSQTETYYKVEAMFDVGPWKGVRLIIEGGKALPYAQKEIVLTRNDGSMQTISEFPNKVPEHEMLLAAALQHNHELFVSMREVRAQWRFVDPISNAWKAGTPPLGSYISGTMPL